MDCFISLIFFEKKKKSIAHVVFKFIFFSALSIERLFQLYSREHISLSTAAVTKTGKLKPEQSGWNRFEMSI